ncbi:uncharacterized [Tachysurus ichikawai]
MSLGYSGYKDAYSTANQRCIQRQTCGRPSHGCPPFICAFNSEPSVSAVGGTVPDQTKEEAAITLRPVCHEKTFAMGKGGKSHSLP